MMLIKLCWWRWREHWSCPILDSASLKMLDNKVKMMLLMLIAIIVMLCNKEHRCSPPVTHPRNGLGGRRILLRNGDPVNQIFPIIIIFQQGQQQQCDDSLGFRKFGLGKKFWFRKILSRKKSLGLGFWKLGLRKEKIKITRKKLDQVNSANLLFEFWSFFFCSYLL